MAGITIFWLCVGAWFVLSCVLACILSYLNGYVSRPENSQSWLREKGGLPFPAGWAFLWPFFIAMMAIVVPVFAVERSVTWVTKSLEKLGARPPRPKVPKAAVVRRENE